MKKITKSVLIIFLLSSLSFFYGCDQLENFELNIPFEINFTVSGDDAADDSETIEFCLNQYDEWNDNKDRIVGVRYLKAAYWTVDYSPTTLKGTISFALYDKDDNILMERTLQNVSPGEYEEPTPYEFELSNEEIDNFNAYLSSIRTTEDPSCQNHSFKAIGSISGLTGTTGDYMVEGKVKLILAAEISPDE